MGIAKRATSGNARAALLEEGTNRLPALLLQGICSHSRLPPGMRQALSFCCSLAFGLSRSTSTRVIETFLEWYEKRTEELACDAYFLPSNGPRTHG